MCAKTPQMRTCKNRALTALVSVLKRRVSTQDHYLGRTLCQKLWNRAWQETVNSSGNCGLTSSLNELGIWVWIPVWMNVNLKMPHFLQPVYNNMTLNPKQKTTCLQLSDFYHFPYLPYIEVWLETNHPAVSETASGIYGAGAFDESSPLLVELQGWEGDSFAQSSPYKIQWKLGVCQATLVIWFCQLIGTGHYINFTGFNMLLMSMHLNAFNV